MPTPHFRTPCAPSWLRPWIGQTLLAWACALGTAALAAEITIATVNNRQMVEMQELSAHFEQAHPDIRLKWVTMTEAQLRERVTADVTRKGAQFDVVTIGMYETPIWAARGWLHEITPSEDYNVKDLIPTVVEGLSHGKRLYAAPFYGEGSMTMYRADLFEKAGLSIHNRPTWPQIAAAAAKVHDPANGVYGLCLRGRAGWGDNMALISTMVNTFGGQWFDMAWRTQIDTKPWHDAVGLYVKLLQQFGPPHAADNSFNENLELFAQGKCAIWVDASSAGGALINPRFSKVAHQTEFALAPTALSTKGAGWLWAWALAIPTSSTHAQAAQRFVQWATSQTYLRLVAQTRGWAAMPSGTRLSTYQRPEFTRAARFALTEAIAMVTANPRDATLDKAPYVGVQFVGIPEFQEIGEITGAEIRNALTGQQTVAQALRRAQLQVEQRMRAAGYHP
ncbi:MAG: ABC transporter substrate-binding protein [Rhodoferax sp.]